ncbi:vWA domain-containing protein [Polyangium mundeleinium]|uniref:VWA domain-containing protein n=1 Tax=Polyangium mundeleinium TaxID=2995306 RepID=A0ABT5EJ54_9BACT|nr:VWA domain-containing protein [Polyangium mundeleinium]MDC0741397.1 VWA domain-containing protein [Polyangium mundeleinium]
MSSPLDLLAPKGLALLGLLGPLVLLYILKVRRKRKRVASTWLWASAKRDLIARSPFQKLIAQVPLILQALALLLLAFALARPATRGRAITGDHLAIIVDASASMSAQSVAGAETKTRMELARKVAEDILSSLGPGSDALLLEAGRDARVVAPLDRDAVRLKAALKTLRVHDVEGDLGAAVALAVDRLRQLGGSRRIVVITDGNLAAPAALSGASLPIEVITVGTPVDNAAIVRVDVRSGIEPTLKREQVQAFLVIANFGKAPRELYVTMREDNASDVLASRKILVAPGERQAVVLDFLPAPGDYRRGLIFDIAPHDAMEVDDAAFARVPAGDKLPVAYAAPDPQKTSPWIERAIVSDPATTLKTLSVAELAQPAAVEMDAFVVVEGACPDFVPGGDLLIVAPPAGRCFGTVVGRTLEAPSITSWETGDARMRFLSLDGVSISRAMALKPEGPTQELIRTQDGTIATDISTPTRTGTLLGFDVGDSDWPLKASFVLFMRNLLEQGRIHRAHGITGPARAGEPLRVRLPASAKDVEVKGPTGDRLDVSLRSGLAVVPEISKVGLYQLSWQGPEGGAIVAPANLTSAAESDLGSVMAPAGSGKDEIKVTAAGVEPDAHNEWSWVLALVALGFVVFDIWYLTRKPRLAPAAAPAAPKRPPAPERRAAA